MQTADSPDVWHVPRSLRLFRYDNPDDPANGDVVWRLLRTAVSGLLDDETFEAAARLPGIGWSRLTSALVLIDAESHLRLSETARAYAEAYGVSPVGQEPRLADYRASIAAARANFPGCELHEIEMFARLQASETEGGQNLSPRPDRCWVATTNASWATHVGGDHWSEFREHHCVRVENSSEYPVEQPKPGDLMLARYGPNNGRGIGVVYRNDYDEEREPEGRIHTLWLNRNSCEFEHPIQPPAFARASESHMTAFRQSAEYSPTWILLDRITYRREVEAALDRDGTDLGKVWKLRRSRKTKTEIRSQVLNEPVVSQTLELLFDEEAVPPTMRKQVAGKVRRFRREHARDFSSTTTAKLDRLAEKCKGGPSQDPHDEANAEPGPAAQPDALTGVPHDLNRILYGPPGTAKTYETVSHALAIIDDTQVETVRENRREDPETTLRRHAESRFKSPVGAGGRPEGQVRHVTFHQNYAYEDFVEGIRPKLVDAGSNDGDSDAATSGSTELAYELRHGIFRSICRVADEARRNAKADGRPAPRYVLVIDEINRGNIPKILGELITLIEPSRRLGADDETTVTLPYSGDDFGVPDNLYIIGTMNTADRSIQQMDTALRRRFTFVEMMPDANHDLISEDVDGVSCRKMLRAINERIAVLLDREHQIGHTYLLNVTTMDQLANRFRNRIFPLLQEYFYDDWRKIRAVLGNNAFVEERPSGEGYRTDLAEDFALDSADDKVYDRIPLDDERWKDAEQYKQIYASSGKN